MDEFFKRADHTPVPIRDGQQYVRNDGVVVTLKRINPPGSRYEFHDHVHNNSYTKDGLHGEMEYDEHWNIAGPYVPKEKR